MSSAGNAQYLKSICAAIELIPTNLLKTAAPQIFEELVQATRVDSGQAAANWHIAPYQGSPGPLLPEEIMWGYGGVDPIRPVGYKNSQFDNSELVYRWQFENAVDATTLINNKTNGVMIYNPIESGFAGFHPGNDAYYPVSAFGSLDIDGITRAAFERAYAEAQTK